eukprot:gnl/TRDRNA2_/TRDRNA2_198395_c0_seq1.p1 gnl/TRDRNA2_/TRDRNA2_198395_c0~~gnl/TRDRNA2_/TRDRNA2_198395_c0_seq1.p1  ORF type:complete len:498 (+),score=65.83 gnl/TRDRNA2_/TRDRNA2_198395_c0_seq1:38-1531(+)
MYPPVAPAPGCTWLEGDEVVLQNQAAHCRAGTEHGAPWSMLDLTAPIRSQIFHNMVGDLLGYSGANETNTQLEMVRSICRELRHQIDEECLTFNYDDTCGWSDRGVGGDREEIQLLNRWLSRHPRLHYFECILHSPAKFQMLLEEVQLPKGCRCSFVIEFKVSYESIRRLLEHFNVRRLNLVPEGDTDSSTATDRGSSQWCQLQTTELRTLCLRNCTDEVAQAFLGASPRLQGLQIVDSRLLSDPSIQSQRLASLSITGVMMLSGEQLTRIIGGCQMLRSLYISKCNISNMSFTLPHLELLSVTHCRQLTDNCVTEILSPAHVPALRYVDLTENRGLLSPTIAHPNLEIAWLMHCPQLTDHAATQMFQNCPSLTAANLVQSSLENACICSPSLRTLELATSQKLSDLAVTQMLEHCPHLAFLDVGHCCQLLEPKFAHRSLETVLLSFCVNLREQAVVDLFAHCPALRYVELAVCMFDMTRFQRECSPQCQVIVNFNF